MDEMEFVLSQLFSAYVHAKVDDGTVAIYARLLSDIPPCDLQTVVDQAIAECRFLPTVAELRERFHALTRTLGQPSATEAWGEVQAQIRAVGYIGTPYFANDVTAQVVRHLGWRDLCASENAIADRAHFMRMYDQLVERGNSVQKLLPQAREMAERRIVGGLQHISGYLPKLPRDN